MKDSRVVEDKERLKNHKKKKKERERPEILLRNI